MKHKSKSDSEGKIYAYSLAYRFVSKITFLFMRIYYRRISVRGQEHVPVNEAIIFAPNHKNALMDPLLILYAFPKKQIVFMARGDFFKNPTAAKILRFFKILPVFRMRNGIGNLSKNKDPFDEAVDTLQHSSPICLMPEGQQVEVRKLLPLVKGMFRIGMKAQEQFGNKPGVKIIPTGIEYEDLQYSGREVLIQFGKPMELSEYYDLYLENEPQAYNKIKEDLYPKISELCLNISSENNYETIYLATLLQTDNYLSQHKLKNSAWNRLEAKQAIVKQYLKDEKNHPEIIENLKSETQKLYQSGKSDDEISRLTKTFKYSDILLMLLFFPVFLSGAFCMFLPYIIIKLIAKKQLDTGFYSTLTFVLGVFVPAFFFLFCFIIGCFIFGIGQSAAIFLIIAPVFGIFSFKIKNLYFDNFKRFFFKRKHTI